MSIIIKNGTLVSMEETRPRIEEKVDILIQNDTIKTIGHDLKELGATVIEATNKIILPGLINTHAHIAMSIFRETLDGYTLQDWLSQKIWPMEDQLTIQDVYNASMLSCIEMIKTGTTTVNDMYFLEEGTIEAAKEVGVRMQLTRTLMDLTGDGETRIEELEQTIQKYQGKFPTITFNIGIHGFYTANPSYIEKCVALAKKYQLPIHIHFCENIKEVEDIKAMYGVTSPVELIERYFSEVPVILAHGVKLTKEEIKELSKDNVSIAHCPVSNLKLGCGIAPIAEMCMQGITVSLGTDGQGSGSNLDLFETMKYTALMQKGIMEDPKELPAYEVLKMATIQGAKALQMEKQIGSIAEGKLADILLVDMQSIMTQPVNNLIAELVYNIKGYNVDTVIINGKIVMQHRKLEHIQETEIYAKCKDIIQRIKIDNS